MKKILILTVTYLISYQCFASDWILASPCSKSFYWDSYGRGIKSAFAQKQNTEAKLTDKGCYQMGQYQGSAILAESREQESCLRSFLEGHGTGVSYRPNHNIANTCFTAGHIAGLADFNIAAREGDNEVAGPNCVRAYNEGRRSYKNGLANDPTSIENNKARYCYGLGWFEAPLF